MDVCTAFHRNPTRDPRTGRLITSEEVYQNLVHECGSPSLSTSVQPTVASIEPITIVTSSTSSQPSSYIYRNEGPSIFTYRGEEPMDIWNGQGPDPLSVLNTMLHDRHQLTDENFDWVMRYLPLTTLSYQKEEYGNTLLHKLIYQWKRVMARLLIDRGVDVNVPNKYGETALMSASFRNHSGIVKRLIDAGASLDKQDEYGKTALISAVSKRYGDIVALLIDAGADLNLQDEYGHTALILATINNEKEIVELLINAGADLNLQIKDGRTALMMATFKNKQGMVQILIDAGADLNIQDDNGNTAFDIANKDIFGYTSFESAKNENIRNIFHSHLE